MKEVDLHRIKEELRNGNNSCLKEVFVCYGNYCIKQLQRKTGCSIEDAEDILMDAVINFREKMLSGRIGHLTSTRHYLFTTCYNMWLVKYHKEQSKAKKIENIKFELYDNEGIVYRQEHMAEISKLALSKLGENCKKIISYFYLEKMSMELIADNLGMASAAVAKTTKARCFKKLMEEVNNLTATNNNILK